MPTALRPVHTYSIVARDAAAGDMGVAVQSHWFSVGSLVPWAEAGVGVVATQSFVDPSYGPKGLALMRSGTAAPEALAALVRSDPGQALRQVAMIDAGGRIGVHTGAQCVEACGHRSGRDYSAQANMMLNADVVPAMVRAYEGARGELAERLLVALEGAELAGGDVRGRQAAAILVVKTTATGRVSDDTVVSLRVEDHPQPLAELRRLLGLHRAYRHMNAGDVSLEQGNVAAAMEAYSAACRLAPDNPEIAYWAAVALAVIGRLDDARPLFRTVFQQDASWRELTRRLAKPGIIQDPTLIEAILACG